MRKRLAACIFSLALSASSLEAHHSLTAEFDRDKPIKLTGKVTRLDWRNPHAWIYLEVTSASGAVEKWQCELGSPNAMTRAGFSNESVKPGDEVVIDGILARDGSKTCSTRVVNDKAGNVVLRQ